MLKRLLADVADTAGLVEALLRIRHFAPRSWLPVLGYHRVHDDAEAQPFDRGVIDATPREFAAQLQVLKHYFTPIGVSELAGHVRRGAPLPTNAALVTFDDGYVECHSQVLPALLSAGVRATFFVSTVFVDQRRVFWWDRISYLVRSALVQRCELAYPQHLELELGRGVDTVIADLLRLVKETPELDLERFLLELGRALCVRWDDELERRLAAQLVLNWDQVRALRAAGMEVQSHTRTHRVLQHLSPDQLELELTGSRLELEQQLGEPVRSISYPVGRPVAAYPHIVNAVRAAGYELGFSSGVSWRAGTFHPYDVGRVLVDRGLPRGGFRAMLAHPAFA